MIRTVVVGFLVLIVAASISLADGRWIHIKVDEKGSDGERVRINLPLALIETVIPMVDADEFHEGKIRIDDHDIDKIDVKGILAAVRDAEDGEYVTVESDEENVTIVKKDDMILIDVDEEDEQVHIKVRMDLLDALVSGDSDEVNILAAIQKLGEDDEGMLVTVDGDDETVRIWVDSNSSGE